MADDFGDARILLRERLELCGNDIKHDALQA